MKKSVYKWKHFTVFHLILDPMGTYGFCPHGIKKIMAQINTDFVQIEGKCKLWACLLTIFIMLNMSLN